MKLSWAMQSWNVIQGGYEGLWGDGAKVIQPLTTGAAVQDREGAKAGAQQVAA